MLKKTMTYKDLDGNDVTEDFYFSMSKSEIAELELSYDGGLSKHLERIVASEDGGEIIRTFKQIVLSAIGQRSEDGRRFIKSPQISEEFSQTEAYSDLFMELVTDAKAAAEFVNGIVPADIAELAATMSASEETPAWIKEDRDPTKQELMSMSTEQMREVYIRKNATVENPIPTE